MLHCAIIFVTEFLTVFEDTSKCGSSYRLLALANVQIIFSLKATWLVHRNEPSALVLKETSGRFCRFSYMKVYKLITLGTKFKTLLSLGRKITMFSKFITNYIEQGWWHSSLTLKCMHLLLKEVNKRGRHAYNLHGWTCLPSGIVMEIHCHITGIFEAAVRLRLPSCCSV